MSGLVSGLVGMRAPAPAQPCLLAYNSADDGTVTGNGAVFTIIYDTEVFDINSDFDGTSTFTAPVTGKYLVIANCQIGGNSGVLVSATLKFVTTNRTYQIITRRSATSSDLGQVTNSVVADFDRADTMTTTITVSGEGSNNLTVNGVAVRTFLSVTLLT